MRKGWQRLMGRQERDKHLDKELRFHIEERIADFMRSGLSEEEARRRVRQEFGGMDQVKEDCRDARRTRWIEYLCQDLRYAVRMLRKSPSFTAVSVAILALGIGVNTAIFSVIDATLWKSLPVRNPGELAVVEMITTRGETNALSYPLFEEIRERVPAFSGVFASSDGTDRLEVRNTDGNLNSTAEVQLVSGEYFEVLGVQTALGRTLNTRDNLTVGGHPMAVLSYRFWKRAFHGDAGVVGRSILVIKQREFSVVGVMPPEFFGEAPGVAPDVWIPLMMQPAINNGQSHLASPGTGWLRIVGRVKAGETAAAVPAMNLFLSQLKAEPGRVGKAMIRHFRDLTVYPGDKGIHHLRVKYSLPLQVLMGTAGLILLLACANLANLLLVRGEERAREMSIRLAIGAGRSRLIRQLMTENLVIAFLGAGLGILIARQGAYGLLLLASDGPEPLPLAVAVDVRVMTFCLAMCLISTLIFGLMPALRSVRAGGALNLTNTPRRNRWLHSGLVIAQIALSVLLVNGAGLFVRTLDSLRSQDLGFRRARLIQIAINPSAGSYKAVQLPALFGRTYEAIRSVPGVLSASMSTSGFASGTSRTCCLAVESRDTSDVQDRQVRTVNVTPGYFANLDLPVVAGRGFVDRDVQTGHVAIVNAAFARIFLGASSPVGARFGWGDPPKVKYDTEIVGVVRNANIGDLREEARPMIYYPTAGGSIIHVRSAIDPSGLMASLRSAIQGVDANIWVNATPVEELVERGLVRETLMATLGTCFGVLAMLLAAVGIYGLTSHTVAIRKREIGIRVALGATRGDVVGLVCRNVSVLTACGIVLGLVASFLSGCVLSSLLFGVAPGDGAVLIFVLLTTAAAAAVAAFLPSMRAASVDPVQTLRSE
jgi:predicted permease